MRAQLVGGGGVQRIGGRGRVGQRVQQVGGGQIGRPRRMLGQLGGGDHPRRVRLRQHQRAQQDALRLGERFGAVRRNAGGALRGGLLEFLAQQG